MIDNSSKLKLYFHLCFLNNQNLLGILSHLSNAIAQRLRIDAVQQRTSLVSHILQTLLPNCHLPTTCRMTFKGRTTIDTVRSAMARLTMKKLGVIFNGACVKTDTITNMFPEKKV